MNIVEIYEKYKSLNKEYIQYNEELLESKFTDNSDESVVKKLIEYKTKFEELKIESDEIEELEDEMNLKDLKYLLVDAIFVSYDLINFYNGNHIERFKMRITNYINKGRRTEYGLI